MTLYAFSRKLILWIFLREKNPPTRRLSLFIAPWVTNNCFSPYEWMCLRKTDKTNWLLGQTRHFKSEHYIRTHKKPHSIWKSTKDVFKSTKKHIPALSDYYEISLDNFNQRDLNIDSLKVLFLFGHLFIFNLYLKCIFTSSWRYYVTSITQQNNHLLYPMHSSYNVNVKQLVVLT